MKIKLRELDEQVDDIIERILRLRGIPKEDISKFLFPDESMKPDYRKLINIDRGVELLKHHIDKGNKIMIIVD